MQMTGEVTLPASRETVWAALNDPDLLRDCIPGCETVERLSPEEMTARVAIKLGPVKASFSGKITLSDLDPPNGYTITGEGSGGVAGFAKGTASVRLSDAPDGGTQLSYQVESQIGGKLAQLGSRLIETTAQNYAREFFDRFTAQIIAQAAPFVAGAEAEAERQAEAEPQVLAEEEEALPGTVPVLQPDEDLAMDHLAVTVERESMTLSPWLWIGGVLVLVAIILAIAVGL